MRNMIANQKHGNPASTRGRIHHASLELEGVAVTART